MSEARLTVLSPEAGLLRREGGPPQGRGAPPSAAAAAPRLDTLENKTLYLVDIGFSGGELFMKRLESWFAAHMPSVKTVRRRKPDNVFRDTNEELWQEVKAKGDAVVLGVAG